MTNSPKIPSSITPLALEDHDKYPALIESVFPTQKISFEAQKERKAGRGQTLTGLGAYWKGRKPLILVRAVVLGSLLPASKNTVVDLEIYEKLMALDDEGLVRRALAKNSLKPKIIANRIHLDNPFQYFKVKSLNDEISVDEYIDCSFPVDCDANGIGVSWRSDITEEDKLEIYRKVFSTFNTYEEKARFCKRPQEVVDQTWLYEPIWPSINYHYRELGLDANSFDDLILQMGILRYGKRPVLGDPFCGGGSIPFEAARLGCDVHASDLNPVACMLTWGAFNVVGASSERCSEIRESQMRVAETVDKEITALGVEHDEKGNRAKAFLYCLETTCPETGWKVPISPTWVISEPSNVIAELEPDPSNKRFKINVKSNVSRTELERAKIGTVQDGTLVYSIPLPNGKKIFRTSIKSLRGDYRLSDGTAGNKIRHWKKCEFKPNADDIFRERLYAIHWISRESTSSRRQVTFFTSAREEDLQREHLVESIVSANLAKWQEQGLVPDMAIEPGEKTTELIRTRGWTYWHHLFNARQLLLISRYFQFRTPEDFIFNARSLDWNSRIARWDARSRNTVSVFYNQALNTLYNYGIRCNTSHEAGRSFGFTNCHLPKNFATVKCKNVLSVDEYSDLWITDPPYADAVNYHEITEYFISWLRKNPPPPFDKWIWDSRRVLAIQGSGNEFRRGMIDAFKTMADHMPDNGLQCVMFTHQDTKVWSDMVGIYWAAGLQVVAAWYTATETTSELKKGGYVQGTVALILRKCPIGVRVGFKQRISAAVRKEVDLQFKRMLNLNKQVESKVGEPVFNDSDLQMASYAAALKVLTSYTNIGGEDVKLLASRPRRRGETTLIDEFVQQAAEVANNLHVPDGLSRETWIKLSGIQRFYLRMMDMETTPASKIDNYQNFAKAFRVNNYVSVMGNTTANKAHLMQITEFKSRDLTNSTEIGATLLGTIIIGMQQFMKDVDPQRVIDQWRLEISDFNEVRTQMIDILSFIEKKAPELKVRETAEVLGDRLKNLLALG